MVRFAVVHFAEVFDVLDVGAEDGVPSGSNKRKAEGTRWVCPLNASCWISAGVAMFWPARGTP